MLLPKLRLEMKNNKTGQGFLMLKIRNRFDILFTHSDGISDCNFEKKLLSYLFSYLFVFPYLFNYELLTKLINRLFKEYVNDGGAEE